MKLGLLAVIVLEIGFLFFMLRVYNDFVSRPESYYQNILTGQAGETGDALIDSP